MEYTILICDDDEAILSALRIYMEQEGFNVIQASDGREALKVVESNTVHLILLDIMMPVMDGIQAAVEIRKISNVPILFLSAKAEDTDRILGLNMGGDDYITKPFNPVELMARVQAALRRYARLGGFGDTPLYAADALGVYQTGDLVLDDNQKQVTVGDTEVQLTNTEYKILRLLISNMGRVFTSAQIYESVWEEPAFDVSKTVSVHIRHIREKIEINPKDPQYLKVLYGLGYKVVKLT